MAGIFRNTNQLVSDVDNFIDKIEESIKVFRAGVFDYMDNNQDSFQRNIQLIDTLEDQADVLKRSIEKGLYKYSLIPEYRADVLVLIDKLDDIADTSKENLYQFDIEAPKMMMEIKDDFGQLTDASLLSISVALPLVKDFFHQTGELGEKIEKVYFYEKEVDKIAYRLKRKLFKEVKTLKLSEKIHLRYFALHIQQISDIAKKIADIVAVLQMKRL
jgi:predicted phosphate transport protein (TIGR00153 family)